MHGFTIRRNPKRRYAPSSCPSSSPVTRRATYAAYRSSRFTKTVIGANASPWTRTASAPVSWSPRRICRALS